MVIAWENVWPPMTIVTTTETPCLRRIIDIIRAGTRMVRCEVLLPARTNLVWP